MEQMDRQQETGNGPIGHRSQDAFRQNSPERTDGRISKSRSDQDLARMERPPHPMPSHPRGTFPDEPRLRSRTHHMERRTREDDHERRGTRRDRSPQRPRSTQTRDPQAHSCNPREGHRTKNVGGPDPGPKNLLQTGQRYSRTSMRPTPSQRRLHLPLLRGRSRGIRAPPPTRLHGIHDRTRRNARRFRLQRSRRPHPRIRQHRRSDPESRHDPLNVNGEKESREQSSPQLR
mmetsp:Transcript_11615/g.23364  ORF Transcript_11615/g.23364 Transcript_11615/m.23364 type:complete len:232 (-) Transcript_11615:660-1355(-)